MKRETFGLSRFFIFMEGLKECAKELDFTVEFDVSFLSKVYKHQSEMNFCC